MKFCDEIPRGRKLAEELELAEADGVLVTLMAGSNAVSRHAEWVGGGSVWGRPSPAMYVLNLETGQTFYQPYDQAQSDELESASAWD